MTLRSDLLKALGLIALLMPAAIADGKADGLVTLASAPVAEQAPDISGQTRMLPVFFEPDSATLTPEAKRVLTRLSAQLKPLPGLHLAVKGHAEPGESGHTALAKKRADAVHGFLVQQGLSGDRLARAAVSGAEMPLLRVANDSPLERRVDIALR
jgi:outer membrane protein OmpA-like peptidoglycan-associated protein